jgi:hypothetical protein
MLAVAVAVLAWQVQLARQLITELLAEMVYHRTLQVQV